MTQLNWDCQRKLRYAKVANSVSTTVESDLPCRADFLKGRYACMCAYVHVTIPGEVRSTWDVFNRRYECWRTQLDWDRQKKRRSRGGPRHGDEAPLSIIYIK